MKRKTVDLRLRAVKSIRKQTRIREMILGVCVISFIATLFCHVVGSMMFEMQVPHTW